MANFSNNTPFQPLKRYTSVRLQQGVPLVDADWNESDDIRRFELRAFLKWFIGDGVPANSPAFAIVAREVPPGSGTFANDNVTISGVSFDTPPPSDRVAYINAGRCLVDGLDVFILDDLAFTEQLLYAGNTPGDDDIVDPDADPIQPIPNTSDPVVIYLDVWEWLVEETEDSDLFNGAIGMTTCMRVRRDWAVRAIAEADWPPTTAGHSYYPLATLSHGAGTEIRPEDITDDRQPLNDLGFLNIAVTDHEERITTNTAQVTDLQTRLTTAEENLNRILDTLLRPAIESFSPRRGDPGDEINLTGRNLQVGAARPVVFFGDTAAELVGTPTETQLTARVPTIPAGEVSITVETPYGRATSDILFEVRAASIPSPEINSFSPRRGPAGTIVTIVGNNFGTTNVVVRFGLTEAELVGAPTDTELVVRVPAMGPGNVAISVSNPGGLATSTIQFEVR